MTVFERQHIIPYKFILLLCGIILSYSVSAQKYTLNDILNNIEQNNPSVLAYQNRIKAANEMGKSARAWMPPMISMEWDDIPYQFDYTKSQLRLSASQTFPNAKRNYAKQQYLKSIADIEKNSGDYFKIELFADAKEAYYKLYVSQRRIIVLEENRKIITLMINLAEKQMAITKGDMAAIYRLKAKLVANETMIIHEHNMIRSWLANLNFLMNHNVNDIFSIDTAHLFKNYRGISSFVSIDSLEYKRSDILRKSSEINSMQLNRTVTALQNKPEFGMRYLHYEKLGGTPDRFSVMGTMTIPSAPWSAKRYKAEVRSIDYRLSSLQQDKQNMINMAAQMIKMYAIELESEYQELDNYTKSVIPSYKKSLDANLLSYGQNTNDMSMTLMAWDDLQMAQMEYLKHLDTYFKIQTEYEKELQIR